MSLSMPWFCPAVGGLSSPEQRNLNIRIAPASLPALRPRPVPDMCGQCFAPDALAERPDGAGLTGSGAGMCFRLGTTWVNSVHVWVCFREVFATLQNVPFGMCSATTSA